MTRPLLPQAFNGPAQQFVPAPPYNRDHSAASSAELGKSGYAKERKAGWYTSLKKSTKITQNYPLGRLCARLIIEAAVGGGLGATLSKRNGGVAVCTSSSSDNNSSSGRRGGSRYN